MDPVIVAFIYTTLAGLSTGIGGLIAYSLKDRDSNYNILSFLLGIAAGLMIYISFVELLRDSIASSGFIMSNIFFFLGITSIYLINRLVPHAHSDAEIDNQCDKAENKKLRRVGVLIAIGIALHNFPEGIAVLFTSLKSLSIGLPLALAIAIHNIPEGMAISIPICHATGSKRAALGYSLFSGLAQPLGAFLAFVALRNFMTPFILDMSISVVAGIMVFISFHDLIPVSREFGDEHLSNLGLFVGMFIMVLSIYLV